MSITQRTSWASLVSLTAGLLVVASVNLLWPPLLTILLALAAAVSGHSARSAIHRDPDRLDGKLMGTVGLVIGYLGLAAGILAVLLLNMALMSFGGG